MRSVISVFLIFFLCVGIYAQSTRILFIGNSYTSVNNLPEIVQQIYASAGESVSVTMVAPGGCTFQQHCVSSMNAIQSGGYDFVVLQEQSQFPSFPEGQFMQQSYPYAQQLCEAIKLYNPDASIAFYMTWARKNGDAQNCHIYPPLCTYEGMDSLLFARYMMMAQDNHTCVSPVGATWHYVRDHYPQIDLYQADESHPAYVGSYIAACCFYTLFTSRNPMDITYVGSLDGQVAEMAKSAVKTIVYDSLSRWCFMDDTIQNDSTPVSLYTIPDELLSVFPNPAQSYLSWSFSPGSDVHSVTIYSLTGNVVSQTFLPQSAVIDISTLDSGIYLFELFDGKHRYHTKFSIVR